MSFAGVYGVKTPWESQSFEKQGLASKSLFLCAAVRRKLAFVSTVAHKNKGAQALPGAPVFQNFAQDEGRRQGNAQPALRASTIPPTSRNPTPSPRPYNSIALRLPSILSLAAT